MRVLHVAAGNLYGGIERMLVTLASTPHARVEQQFVLVFGGRLERELSAAGAVVHCLPSPRATRPLMIWRARRAFAAVLDDVKPDAVLFHGAWPHAMLAPAAARANVRLGFWQHQPIARPSWPDRWARHVRPHFVVFNSAFTQARPAFPGVPGMVIHCPVPPPAAIDDRQRQSLRGAAGATPETVVVLMAARFERLKGHEVLLQAAPMLASTPVRIWIAGGVQRPAEVTYQKQLEALAAANGASGIVSFLGERDDVPTLMQLADIYCQPNLRGESFGISIAEAMHAALPCVVSALGGAAELLDQSCGIITSPGDAAEVASAVTRLANDPALRAAMGRAAVERASRLTDPAGRLDQLETIVTAAAA
jgi:glycosyltransferase involved in cell wall biosynthesis